VGERFFQEFTLRQVLLNAAKNGCGPSAAGTSSRAEGPNIRENVKPKRRFTAAKQSDNDTDHANHA
jgi:hypothetical protein